jgi:hypothetical protein
VLAYSSREVSGSPVKVPPLWEASAPSEFLGSSWSSAASVGKVPLDFNRDKTLAKSAIPHLNNRLLKLY